MTSEGVGHRVQRPGPEAHPGGVAAQVGCRLSSRIDVLRIKWSNGLVWLLPEAPESGGDSVGQVPEGFFDA